MVKLTMYLTERQYADMKEFCLLTGLGFTEAMRRFLDLNLGKALLDEREHARNRDTREASTQNRVEQSSLPETPSL